MNEAVWRDETGLGRKARKRISDRFLALRDRLRDRPVLLGVVAGSVVARFAPAELFQAVFIAWAWRLSRHEG